LTVFWSRSIAASTRWRTGPTPARAASRAVAPSAEAISAAAEQQPQTVAKLVYLEAFLLAFDTGLAPAVGYQLTFATSDTLNFGQGDALMLGALVGLTLVTLGVNYWLMIPLVCLFGAVQGAVVERIGVRPAIKIKSEFGWIMSTIALGIIFKNVAENVWGRDDRPFPTPIPSDPIKIFGVDVTWLEISVAVGVIAIMALVEVFRRKTLLGKAFEAVSADRDAAELMGISATRTVMLSYALSGAVAALAGILVSPITTVGPTMAAGLVLKAFSVAVVAGLESGFGVVLIGLILGALEGLASLYIGSGWRESG
jgi:branched-chain amino acid transport system permease protein